MSKGINSIINIMDVVLAIGVDIIDAAEDGKVSFSETLGLSKHIPGVIGAIKAAPDLPGELADLDDAERQQIIDHFSEKFDLPNDELELRVERLFGVAVNLAEQVVEIVAVVQEFRADD